MKKFSLKNKELTPHGKKVFGSLAILIFAICTITFVVIYDKKKNEFKTINNPQKAQEVAISFKEKVGKIYVLPDENPTIATVTDINVLPNDAFYDQAKDGDKILIFANAKKIVLYRPSINKVVDVGTVEPAAIPKQDIAGTKTTINATASSQTQSQPKVILNSESAVSPTTNP